MSVISLVTNQNKRSDGVDEEFCRLVEKLSNGVCVAPCSASLLVRRVHRSSSRHAGGVFSCQHTVQHHRA